MKQKSIKSISSFDKILRISMLLLSIAAAGAKNLQLRTLGVAVSSPQKLLWRVSSNKGLCGLAFLNSYSQRSSYQATCHDQRRIKTSVLHNRSSSLSHQFSKHCVTMKRNLSSDESNNEQSLDPLVTKAISSRDFYAPTDSFPDFESLGIQSPVLLQRIKTLFSDDDVNNNIRPSAVQSASFQLISSGKDVVIGSETGSGKTLAYLLPLLDDILMRKKKEVVSSTDTEENDDFSKNDFYNARYDYARAIILVPNKELANQVLRMSIHLCGGPKSLIWGIPSTISSSMNTFGLRIPKSVDEDAENGGGVSDDEIVRLGMFSGGDLKLTKDYKPFRMSTLDPTNNPPLDIVIATPAALSPLGLNPKNIDLFADVQTLVIDEADMLFDGGYLRPLGNVLMGFRRADRLIQGGDSSFGVKKTQHVLVAATLPDMGLRSVEAYIQKKFPYATRITMSGMHNARHNGLKDQTLWIEDDPDERQVNKKRMERLVKLLQTEPSTSFEIHTETSGLSGEKVMVFLNSVEDVDKAANALRRGGIKALPFHAKIPLSDRTEHLNDFRKFVAGDATKEEEGTPVLVCTDLAARGLDVAGVTAIVQLQFAGNVVGHLHRMGRCGRAGNRNGRGIIFYGGFETELVKVVREAETQQRRMILEGNEIEELGEDKIGEESGKVNNAFSRKRGFTRKRKRLKNKAAEEFSN